ncbi:HNH endonuclease [Elizabethkingia anophelis]|uniref:HNH endonuclease n=1 Tax=Elizabethkingia anophelis TaxID=1117645 RepID=UPI0007508E41|nr:HNH endonuclease [Elizabethkingia anophelis]AQW91318.1 hypothetical protein BBD28_11920 [Elizabethkingia anophelis]KUY14184.1 hypothetical protein ATB94_09300 [Elizabethkingia anophelis]
MNTKYVKIQVSEELFQEVTRLFGGRPLKLNGECIEWTMHVNRCGYGVLKHNGRLHRAHRFIYNLYHKVGLGELHVLHKCDNPRCVNPEHLFLGTCRDNIDDKVKKGRSKTGKTSKYRFISYRKDTDKWRVVKKIEGKDINFGQFDSELEAWDYVKNNLL